MATIDASTSALLKTRAVEKMETNVYVGKPAMALFPKKFNIGGKVYQSPLQIGAPLGRGKRFADAVANVALSKRVEMDIVHQESYAFGYAPGLDAALATGKANTVEDLLGVEQDSAYAVAAAMVEQTITRGDGYGTMAQIASVVSGTTGTVVVQLAAGTFNDCFSIFVGDILAAKTDPATASLATGTWTVTVTDAMLGRITMTAAGGADATSYAGYSLGLAATYANSTALQTMQSLRTMFTRTGLTNAFEGLASRASDPVRLAGHVFSVGTMSAKDAISLLISSIGNFGGADPKYALVSSATYLEVEQDLGDQVRYTETSGTGKGTGASVLFPSMTYQGPRGPVTVMQVPTMLDTDIFVIDPSSFTLTAVDDELIKPLDEGDAGWIQLQGSDAKRLSLRTFGGFSCQKFWANGRAIRTV